MIAWERGSMITRQKWGILEIRTLPAQPATISRIVPKKCALRLKSTGSSNTSGCAVLTLARTSHYLCANEWNSHCLDDTTSHQGTTINYYSCNCKCHHGHLPWLLHLSKLLGMACQPRSTLFAKINNDS